MTVFLLETARKSSWAIVLAGLVLSGCQTTGTGTAGNLDSASRYMVAKESYTIFFDQKDHLNELIAANNYADASILYEEQRSYFDTKAVTDPELNKSLATVVDHIHSAMSPPLETSLQVLQKTDWPVSASEWPTVRMALDTGEAALADAPSGGIMVNKAFQPDVLDALRAAVVTLRSKIETTAKADFAGYDHVANSGFFTIHPTARDPGPFFTANPAALTTLVHGWGAEQIGSYAATIGKPAFTDEQWQELGQAYAQARMAALPPGRRDLAQILAVVNDARTSGFDIKALPGVNVGFVEVTSRTLLKQGQIDFPAAIDVDLPFNVSKAEIESAFTPDSFADSDYLIVFDVALAKAQRRIGRMQKAPSETIVGYRQEANPAHAQLQNSLNMAQMAAQNASMNLMMRQNQYCEGLGCIVAAIAVNQAREKRDHAQSEVQRIMSALNSESPLIEVPVKRPYTYEVADIAATKTMTVHYYVIDREKKRYFKSTFDIVENEKFGVAYRIEENDPNKQANTSKHDTEKDVAAWEKEPSTVKLSQLVDHYLANRAESRQLTSLAVLRTEMLADRNTAIAEFKSNTFAESTRNDPRFDSVVVIYMPGSLGSGFFVRPDVVMTNYHVVEENDYAELKMHDEQETFGKVIARDAVLDLALIKVQARGKPARFFDKNKIDLGSTVEVIGHPRGFEFAITRGVVSAVRKLKSANLGAGSDVLQIQIDAATSPGNSGGPVFLGDQVISIVSWGRVDPGSENLNFTIHHAEAERFLRESLGSRS